MEHTKTCTKCGETKTLDEFHRNNSSRDGRYPSCRGCRADHDRKRKDKIREYNQKYYATPDKKARRRERALKRAYGITVEAYDLLLEAQGDACAICKKPCKTGRKLSVDHHHETGAVRGLLCLGCNVALGGFIDDIDLLQAAIDYLIAHHHNT